MSGNLKNKIFEYIKKEYKVLPDYPWQSAPDYAVFRHTDNKKWFALYMNVKRKTLGLAGESYIDILNLKPSNPFAVDEYVQQRGILRGYHMNHSSWISVLLDGTVTYEQVTALIDESFFTTASKKKK